MKPILLCAALLGPWAGHASGQDESAPALDTLQADWDSAAVQEKLSDMNLSKALDRVGFSGLMYNRAWNHQYLHFTPAMSSDAAWTALDANFTLKVTVNANSFMKVWSMLSFGYDFGGHFLNDRAGTHIRGVDLPGFGLVPDTTTLEMRRAAQVQDKNREGARVFEDLMAGVDIRTSPMEANVRAGGTLWSEGSPFTIWKRDPRPHPAWYFESYEPEQSSGMYYTQKFFFRRNDLGRSSWPKKAFGGIEMDAYKLPGNLGLQVNFMQPSNMLPTKTDGNTNTHVGDAEAIGSINSIGRLYYGRLTRKKVLKDVTAGANILWVDLPQDLIYQQIFSPNSPQGFKYQFKNGAQPFYTNPHVFSLDTRGNLSPTLFIMSDLGASMEDSVKYLRVVQGTDSSWAISRAASKPAPAAYLKMNSTGKIPLEFEAFYASKPFWSPYAMTEYAVPVHHDELKLGAGTFNYMTNLLGLNLKVSPKVDFGFFSVTVGQHVQAEKGKDILRFQHNLNGREYWYSTASWSRTEPGRMLDEGQPYGNPKYEARVGEIRPDRNILHLQNQPGGLRGDDLEVWEEFVAYDSPEQANSGMAPEHQKYASSLSMDWGYNLAPMMGYGRPFMLALYTTLHSIATDLTGPLNSKNTLLWSSYVRLEPAISLSSSFQLLGLVGLENWKSDKAYRNTLYNQQSVSSLLPGYHPISVDGKAISYNNQIHYEAISSYLGASIPIPYVEAEKAPIDYLQYAYGMGFDWDFSSRAGLHMRIKYANHEDKNLPSNNWDGIFVFGETKIWF